MAGDSMTFNYASGKAFHENQYINDYNENVIVPRSILVDTADAIRLKKNGSTAIETDENNIVTLNGIEPADFATEIGNLASGFSLSDFQTAAASGSYSTTTRQLQWKGDIRKINFIFYGCNHNNASYSSFHRGYIFLPFCLNQSFTYGQNTYIPIIGVSFGGASGNTYVQISATDAQWPAVLLTNLSASYGASDNTSFTANLFDTNAQNFTTGYNGYGRWIRSGITV